MGVKFSANKTNQRNNNQNKKEATIAFQINFKLKMQQNMAIKLFFYESVNSMKLQTIVENGFFRIDLVILDIRKLWGSNLVRRPDPVLITDTLSHKTQILYQADISFVIAKLNIQPGSVVVESGTGSASLSSSIAKTIQSEGHLYTFEFNEARAKNGVDVLQAQGLSNFDVIWRDVLSNGFLPISGVQIYGLKENMADAVFLDLPRPYKAICHAKQVLKKGGRICCFSPCIEQVMKNCEEMRSERFVQILTVEIIQRPFEKRERVFQSAFTVVNPNFDLNQKRKREELGDNIQDQQAQLKQEIQNNDGDDDNNEINQEDDEEEENESQEEENESNKNNKQKGKNNKNQNRQSVTNKKEKVITKFVRPNITKILYSSGPKEIKGHTGYLSFGILM